MQSKAIEFLSRHSVFTSLNKTIVDIGASDGLYTSNSYDLIIQYGWNGLLFDPQEDILAIAQQHHKDNIDHVLFFPVAIAEVKGRVVLFGHPNDYDGKTTLNHGASLIEIPNYTAKRAVNAISYQDFLSIISLSTVGVLAIDTEGYDFSIIDGLFKLTKDRPQVIITETEYYLRPDERAQKEELLSREYILMFNESDQLWIAKSLLEDN
jgi:FkbM family methyltransferase